MLRMSWPPSFRSVVAICALAALAVIGTGVTLSAPSVVNPATVMVVRDDVFVRHGLGAYLLASDGQMLGVGDRVRTGSGGAALITYFDGSTVRLEPDSEVVIEVMQINSTGRVIVLMIQTAGRAWYTIASALSPSSRYEVRTTATAAVVRAGSTVQVDVASSEETTVVALEAPVETAPAPATVIAAVSPVRTVQLTQPTISPVSAFVPKLDLPTLPSLNAAGKTPPGQQKDRKQKPGRA